MVQEAPISEKNKKYRRFWLGLVWAAEILALGGAVLAIWVLVLIQDLPDIDTIKRYRPRVSTQVRDVNGQVLLYLGRYRNRIWLPLKSISPWLVKAVVTSEDDTFFKHSGIRVEQIRKAFFKNLEKGRYAVGASTITQQLAKNIFLSREKTLVRKAKEFFVAGRIEQALPKWRILELYLNEIEWGQGIYGVQTAAKRYFGKSAAHLSLVEASILAGMLSNPRYYNPFERREKVRQKQLRVLRLMHNNGVITQQEYQAAQAAPWHLSAEPNRMQLAQQKNKDQDCEKSVLVSYLEAKLGQKLYQSGAKLQLTIDRQSQTELRKRFGRGHGESLLIAKQDDIVRAFVCIGGSQWENKEIPAWPQADVPAESPLRDHPPVSSDWLLERLTPEEFKDLSLFISAP